MRPRARDIMDSLDGIITEITATRANIDARELLLVLLAGIHGMVIADMGLIGADDQMNCDDVHISTYKRATIKRGR